MSTGRPRGRPRRNFQDTVASAAIAPETTPRMVETQTIERPSARPEARPDDPRVRAAARAAQLREHGALDAEMTDDFQLPPGLQPDGWEYEWKRHTVVNQEDPGYQVQLAQRGFGPVPASRHPELMPTNYTGSTIERKGMILMERPKEINDESRARAYREATRQVQSMEEKLSGAPPGTLERTAASVKKSYSPVEIPSD